MTVGIKGIVNPLLEKVPMEDVTEETTMIKVDPDAEQLGQGTYVCIINIWGIQYWKLAYVE